MIVKPPYTIAALARERLPREEVLIIGHIDKFVRAIRSAELLEILGPEPFGVIEKHVQAAYEYYSSFSGQDLALLQVIDSLSEHMGEEE